MVFAISIGLMVASVEHSSTRTNSLNQNPELSADSSLSAPASTNAYMAVLQRRIRRQWNPPREDRSKKITVRFTVTKTGKIKNKRIELSCGDPHADAMALKAIDAAAPYPLFPPSLSKHPSVEVEFTFDYQVTQSQ